MHISLRLLRPYNIFKRHSYLNIKSESSRFSCVNHHKNVVNNESNKSAIITESVICGGRAFDNYNVFIQCSVKAANYLKFKLFFVVKIPN